MATVQSFRSSDRKTAREDGAPAKAPCSGRGPGLDARVSGTGPSLSLAALGYPDVARFVYRAGRVAHAQNDFQLTKQLYQKAAGLNYVASYINLGVLSYQVSGTPKDYDAARRWYKKLLPPTILRA